MQDIKCSTGAGPHRPRKERYMHPMKEDIKKLSRVRPTFQTHHGTTRWTTSISVWWKSLRKGIPTLGEISRHRLSIASNLLALSAAVYAQTLRCVNSRESDFVWRAARRARGFSRCFVHRAVRRSADGGAGHRGLPRRRKSPQAESRAVHGGMPKEYHASGKFVRERRKMKPAKRLIGSGALPANAVPHASDLAGVCGKNAGMCGERARR